MQLLLEGSREKASCPSGALGLPCRAWLQILPQPYMGPLLILIGFIDEVVARRTSCFSSKQGDLNLLGRLYNDCPADQFLKQTMPRPAAEESG